MRNFNLKVLHLWHKYSPGLFDRSFEICLEEGIDSRLVCMHLFERGRSPAHRIACVRRLQHFDSDLNLPARLRRKCRLLVDQQRFRSLVARTIGQFKPDLIHVHAGTTAALLERELLAFGRPFIISFYGHDISQGAKTPAVRDSYQRLMVARPLIHVLCEEVAERALALGAPRERIVDANLPLPVERYPYVGVDEGGAFRWLIPARFVEKKGHVFALHAFRKHLEDHPASRLTCWGYGRSAWLRDLVHQLDLGDRVTVIDNTSEGPFDDAYLRRLRDHDAVLAPSVAGARGDDEGGPALTTVLAQVAGKPVIMSSFPGHERSLTDGIEGFVVPQRDAPALSRAMAELSRDRQRARALGQAGRERAIGAFSEDAYRGALLGWYRALVHDLDFRRGG